MSYIAVTTGTKVLTVESNEAASLESMSAFASLGYKRLRRIWTDAAAFVAFSNGRELETDLEVVDGKATTVIVKS